MSGYDERLLADAPALTREEKYAGYSVDLLENDGRVVTPPLEQAALAPPSTSHAEAAIASKEALETYPERRPTPWWRTTKWMIVFAVLAVVAIGAIVGGAVGGSRHGKHAIATPSPSAGNAGGGANSTSESSSSSSLSIATSTGDTTPATNTDSIGVAGGQIPKSSTGSAVVGPSATIQEDSPNQPFVGPSATSAAAQENSPNNALPAIPTAATSPNIPQSP